MNRIAQKEQIISCLDIKGRSSISSTLNDTAYKLYKCIAYSTCESNAFYKKIKKVLIFNSSLIFSYKFLLLHILFQFCIMITFLSITECPGMQIRNCICYL